MTTMRCRHCGTTIAYPSQDLGRQFDCAGCGRPGLLGYGLAEGETPVERIPLADEASIPFAADAAIVSVPARPVPAATRRSRFTIGKTLKIAGATALLLFAIFGLVRKGAKLGRVVGPAVTWVAGGESGQPPATKP